MSDYLINNLITLEAIVAAWEPPLAEAVYACVAQDPTGHDVYHCLRVKQLALHIAAGEGLDPEIMTATAYLHDIGRGREFQGQGDHVEFGMAQAEKLLPDVAFPAHKIAAVVGCIAHHEEYAWATNRRPLPEDIHGEILGFQDADRLDAIGAVGLARMFTFGGAYRRPLWEPHIQPGYWEHGRVGNSSYTHLYEKLFKLKDTLNTPTGRQLAASRHQFMERFAEQFEQEWFGQV